VIAVGPIDFSLPKFVGQYMTSRCSIAECMEYKPHDKPTTVHLVPRPGGKAGERGGSAMYAKDSSQVLPFVMRLPSTLQGQLLACHSCILYRHALSVAMLNRHYHDMLSVVWQLHPTSKSGGYLYAGHSKLASSH